MQNAYSIKQGPLSFSIPVLSEEFLQILPSHWEQDEALNRAIDRLSSPSQEEYDTYLGWRDFPSLISLTEIEEIEQIASDLRKTCQDIVCIGIGGSYLGAKAIIEALSSPLSDSTTSSGNPRIFFAGHNLSSDYIQHLSLLLKGRSFGIVYISKSGTTLEPALAFRIFRNQLEQAVGKDQARKQIVCITDPEKGNLNTLATAEQYPKLTIPRNIGGRFSVLTAVGLLPIALAGFDIRSLIQGAKSTQQEIFSSPFSPNIASLYAYFRHRMYQEGKRIENYSCFVPQMTSFGEWLKQLFGESEGKQRQGIFPSSTTFPTDLHSMGQWIQDGERTIFETFIQVEGSRTLQTIPSDPQNSDSLNYLSDKSIDEINKIVEIATIKAHLQGEVPISLISIDALCESSIGALVYFFEVAVALSGYLFGINPFDQPGVEAYKNNMFELLGKPI